MKTNPIIAIVGRPNVGKSTFFNRVLKRRKAIVHSQEGITRDRIYGDVEWTGFDLTFVDTGGYIPDDADIFNAAVREQAVLAMREADLILFMVDGRVAPTPSDHALAQLVREAGKPFVLVVNKCDSLKMDEQIFLYHELGLEPVLPISALNGRLTGDLLDAIVEKLELKREPPAESNAEEMSLAIVGMPNVGKSSLTNALLQKDQTIVTPIAGTTRDSIDTHLRWYGKDVILIDTAGLRKQSKITDNIEYYSNVRTHKTIARADVVLVLIDAVKGFTKQDKTILEQVIQKGKGLVIIVNKWDLLKKDANTMQDFLEEMVDQFRSLSHYPVLFISALTKQRVSKVLDVAWNVHQARQQRIPTKALNEWLQKVTANMPPPAIRGKMIKIKYITQVNQAPIIFALYANFPGLIPVAYQRYLENQLRQSFKLEGVPVKLSFRKK
ncbi:MAG: ribosome biogenesis GTPase Der [FCB group bacterium]|nr:ribosome biogenesis GTPase Der [FCB group bacterium]